MGLRHEGAALRPIILQSVIVALLIGLLTLGSRLRLPQRWIDRGSSLTPTELALFLLGSQIVLSGLMELTERLALGGAYATAFRTGFLDVGFGVELLIAIVSALLLVSLAIGIARAIRALLPKARTRTNVDEPRSPIEPPFVRRVLTLAGSGGVRAPPSTAAFES